MRPPTGINSSSPISRIPESQCRGDGSPQYTVFPSGYFVRSTLLYRHPIDREEKGLYSDVHGEKRELLGGLRASIDYSVVLA
jgi:hypothetical protein